MTVTTFECPRPTCLALVISPINLHNVRIVGFGANVVVSCWRCGEIFDAAPGYDVTVSTVRGRLRRITTAARTLSTALADLPRDDLRRMRDEVARAAVEGRAPDLSWVQNYEAWARRYPALSQLLANAAVGVLLAILGVLLTRAVVDATTPPAPATPVTEAELARIVSAVLEAERARTVPGGDGAADPSQADGGRDGQMSGGGQDTR